ncbi:fish-egg lectin-like [Heteronotia binoei]|uniref:fish-egg lectin-like n=1 Tax=Heteronotia binoei TaxID=13085 RepID=UPI00292EF1DD|nr:fish-egg lectin-like [Heteronotia binoei]XP_060105821.1 fish-egg lectin-like [Heteronotia binoei]XP_060105822.1 fish-egg lectin-like [Heteronotia binoei]
MRGFCEWLLLLLALCGSTSGLHSSIHCNLREGRASQIDAGSGQVFGVNPSNATFTVTEHGLLSYPGKLKEVSPGPNGIWAVKSNNRAARWLRDNWVEIGGHLTRIDAGGNHIVAGIINDAVRCLPKSKIIQADVNQEVEWDHMEGKMKHIACGRWGCWAVDGKGQAYFRHGITEDSCVGSSWTEEGRGFSKIEAGTDGDVYGLSNDQRIYRRVGISKQQPAGTGWALVELEPHFQGIKDMSYDLRTLWIVTPDFSVFKCLTSSKLQHNEEE